MTKCIFCESTDTTISMEVKTERGPQVAHICAEHEDEASPKKVRELVTERDKKLADFERIARELGYQLVPMGGIVAANSQPNPQDNLQDNPKSQPAPSKQPIAEKITPKKQVKPRSMDVPVQGGGATVERYSAYDTAKEDAPAVLDHEVQEVAAHGGVPTVIPKKVDSEAGTTTITIIDSGGDRALQDRFRQMTEASKSDRGPNFKDGYALGRDCTFCEGTGIGRIDQKACPKCKGTGTI